MRVREVEAAYKRMIWPTNLGTVEAAKLGVGTMALSITSAPCGGRAVVRTPALKATSSVHSARQMGNDRRLRCLQP